MCCKNSLHWHHVDEEEWSINEKTELLVETLSLLFEVFDVDDSPFLVETTMLWPSNNFLSFKIFSCINIKCLAVVDRDDVFSLQLPELPGL
jgi:hypothetical protein